MQNELSGHDNIISFLSWGMPNVNEKESKSAANTSVAYIESLRDTRFKVFYSQLNELFFTYTKITEVELKETKTSLNFNSKSFGRLRTINGKTSRRKWLPTVWKQAAEEESRRVHSLEDQRNKSELLSKRLYTDDTNVFLSGDQQSCHFRT